MLALVAAGLAYLAGNVARNLEASGMAGGFGFLREEAGFAMSFSLIEVSESSTYGRVFLAGLSNTIFIAALALVSATALGFVVGFARTSTVAPVRGAAALFVELLRNLPLLLVLIFIQAVVLRSLPVVREAVSFADTVYLSNRGIYFPWPRDDHALAAGVAVVLGTGFVVGAWLLRPRTPILSSKDVGAALAAAAIGSALLVSTVAFVDWERPALRGFDFTGGAKLMPELAALLLALTLYNASFIAELVRAGLQSVDRGQVEAAMALGLRPSFIRRRIVLPQAMRLIVPPLTNQYVHLIKASSLATVVGFPDLVAVFLGTALNQTGRAVEIVAMTAGVYLTLCLAVASVSAAWNARSKLKER
ncbi:ABC transporter permease subunit [Salinarimonas rosea]|uniref:ABC transporter permease subunit n=1 Tax=Salinarimonas rosea TaxID=552063 RepID=UPI00146F98DA|nr:ABC transporter permease subunit [Salinarimonas rosea]